MTITLNTNFADGVGESWACETTEPTRRPSSLLHDSFEDEVEGPMRFAPKGERRFDQQLVTLSPDERVCFDALKARWEARGSGPAFTDDMYLRFARCSPGPKKFDEEAAWRVMKKFDPRYLALTAISMEEQLLSKTCFIPPGLRSTYGHDVLYMRPSRYCPKETSTKDIINNLAYCMQVMVEKEKACAEGIAFLANMDGWDFSHFSIPTFHQFMQMLQGSIPIRVRLVLIVDPPGWFDKVWPLIKPVLAEDFRKKIRMIKAAELSEFLEEGYQHYLPDDIENGKASTDSMVSDFVAYRKYAEGSLN